MFAQSWEPSGRDSARPSRNAYLAPCLRNHGRADLRVGQADGTAPVPPEMRTSRHVCAIMGGPTSVSAKRTGQRPSLPKCAPRAMFAQSWESRPPCRPSGRDSDRPSRNAYLAPCLRNHGRADLRVGQADGTAPVPPEMRTSRHVCAIMGGPTSVSAKYQLRSY